MEGEENFDCTLNAKEEADFLAGFIFGFTGHDQKAYLESCYHDTPQFETDICNAVNDFSTKDNQKVIEGVQTILKDLPQLKGFMDACPNAAGDWAAISNWFKFWKGQGEMKVYSTAYKNLVANMGTVKEEASKISADYTSGDFYGAANEAATIAKLALPVQAAEFLQ